MGFRSGMVCSMRVDSPHHEPQGVLGYAHRRQRSPFVLMMKFVVAAVAVALLVFAMVFVIPQGPSTAAAVPVRLEGSSAQVTQTLEAAGVLRYRTAFRVALQLRGSNANPGQYVMSPHLSVWSLARLVTSTQPRPERTLTMIEGWNLRDIGRYIEEEHLGNAEVLFALVGAPAVDYRTADSSVPRPKDFSTEFPLLVDSGKPPFIGFEGYLFPDTYRVYADASVEDIVRKMFENLAQKLTPELQAEIATSGRSLHQILTMASIIEAEISNHADRPTAAGILWKRRDSGMLLQVDATVNYITGKHDPRVSRDDAATDSSYNTYKYPGLPRGPIGNPGMSAILAALHPVDSPYWFFLTAPDGRTVFSRTLDEHNTHVTKYLR